MTEVKVTEGAEISNLERRPDSLPGPESTKLCNLGLSSHHSGSQLPYLKTEKVKLRSLLVLILKL